MAGENKLLGVLQLKADGVLATIDQVNQKLKSLGEGVDLDLTKILNAKVNSQLENLKKQIDDVNRAATSRSAQQNQEIKEASKLIKEQIDLQTKLVGAQGQNQKDVLAQQISERAKAINELDPKIREQAAATETATKAQERYNVAVAKAQDKEYAKRQSDLNQQLKQTDKDARQAAASFELMANRMTMIVGRFSLQLLREQWQAAVSYAEEYYDRLNEIRVVTGMTEAESRKLGASFRQMAQEMSVTSTEIASAAVTFYRQGLNDAQVKSRLEWVTKYAKVASISFESAAELITASANAMSEDIQGDIQRVVDVFLYLGDNAATTGEEVGKAMQKASASATEFGVSFEWLGSWIATVAEQTRQAPETIGNAFNSMMARLHSIRATGYNSEDEVNINQVAKALATVNVALMDQEGNWRDMTDIFNEVAEQWDSMTGKQKSYIATTVAGVRQQNVFFALMNDLSKGIEDGSRAWELYTGALNSAGTATQKYATWQESVAAAQANLTNSLEELYAKVSGNSIKTFYNFFAGFIDGLTRLGDIAIWASILAGIAALGLAIRSFYVTLNTANKFVATSAAVFNAHPLFMAATVIVGILGLVGAIGSFVNAVRPATKSVEDYSRTIEEMDDKIASLEKAKNTIATSFEKMQNGTKLTNQELANYNSALSEVSSLSPGAAAAVNSLTSKMGDQTKAAKELNDELDRLIKNGADASAFFAQQRFNALSIEEKSGSTEYELKEFLGTYGYQDTNPSSFADAIRAVNEDYDRYLGGFISTEDSQRISQNFDLFEKIANTLHTVINELSSSGRITLDSTGRPGDNDFGLIADMVHGVLFGDGSIDDFESFLKTTADTWVQAAVDVVARSVQMDDVQTKFVASMMEMILFGENGELEYSDFSEQTKARMQALINNLIKGIGPDPSLTRDMAVAIIKKLMPDMTPASVQSWIYGMDNSQDWFEPFVTAYIDMVMSGLSEADIIKMVDSYAAQTGLGIADIIFTNFSEAIQYGLWKAIGEAMGGETVDPWALQYEYFNEEGGGWGADYTAQKLMLDLLNLGKTKEEIDQAFSESSSLDEFVEKLQKMIEETKNATEETYNLSDHLKHLNTIESVIKDIKENGHVDFDTILGLAETNPELLIFIQHLDSLEKRLQQLRAQEEESVRQYFTDMVMNSKEIFAASGSVTAKNLGATTFAEAKEVERAFYTSGTYGAYGDKLAADAEAKTDKAVGAIVNSLLRLREEEEETVDATKDFIDAIVQSTDEFDDMQSLLNKIKTGDQITFGDLWKFSETHPELLLLIGDMRALEEEIQRIKEIDAEKTHDSVIGWMSNTEAVAQLSPFASYLSGTVTTLQQLKNVTGDGNPELLKEIDAWLQKIADDAVAALEETEALAETTTFLEQQLNELKSLEEATSLLDAVDPTKNGYSLIKALEAQTQLAEKYSLFNILNDQYNHGEMTLEDYLSKGKKILAEYSEEAYRALRDGGYNIVTPEDAENARNAADALQALTDAIASYNSELEVNQASQSGFSQQINELAATLASEGIARATEIWKGYTDEMRSAIEKEYPALVQAIRQAEASTGDLSDETKSFGKELNKAQWKNSVKTFKNTAKAIDELERYTINATDAYAAFYAEAEKAVTAQSEFLTATDKLADGSELAAEDIKNLADFLGFAAPEALIENWDQVGPLLAAAIDEGTEALNRLQEAAFIKITGTSEADFSAIQNGLISTKNMAEDTVNALLATGQWTVETLRLDTEAWVQDAAGKWHLERLTGYQQILKPTKNNLLGGAKSSYVPGGATSSGGGGGGGSSSKGMTEVERMLDRMAQIQDIQDHTRSLYSAQANLFKETGQLQGVIQYYQKEIGAIEKQNETLQANIAEMEPWLEKKRAEVAALKVTDAEYEEAASDLKALQERHQQYTLALINNTVEMDKLTDAIKEQRDAIRQMEIDLRNTILDAIKDREALNERMLEGTIKVEEEILELIKRRYEKERDMILENTEKQISALEKERDLLSEQLELRKQQAEEEDKAARLAELEAKYARISADPTRQKEALSIQKDIQDLRDEMAWDLAEKEVKAQQDSIDQQIDSLEDYSEYIQNYYEYLFEHPKKLIEEMKTIIMGTDEEIIAWLIKNDEEYAEATEATKKQTEDSWREMLRDMRGELELFWDEVEYIISQGDDYIINFLKENSAEYREAGKLQAEAYVDEWKKQLEDLRKAYEQVSSDVTPYDYTYIAPAEGSNSGGGGGGGGGGANAASSAKAATLLLLSMADITGGSLAAGNGPINQNKEWADLGTHYWNVEDGDLIQKALNNSTTIRTPTMPNIGSTVNNNGSSMNVGDIIVNVDTLDKDADYEEMAQKVLNAVTEKMNRGAVVGGIRHYTK